jgi:hypothetical protein
LQFAGRGRKIPNRRQPPVQDVLQEIIRWLGWAALKLLTLGRYRGGLPADMLAEGAIGFALIVAVGIMLVYTF